MGENNSKEDNKFTGIIFLVAIQLWGILIYIILLSIIIQPEKDVNRLSQLWSHYEYHALFLLIFEGLVYFYKQLIKFLGGFITKAISEVDFDELIAPAINKASNNRALEIPLNNYMINLPQSTPLIVRDIVYDRLEGGLSSILSCIGNHSFELHSSELYRYIRDKIMDDRCNNMLIIDHDINRWQEVDKAGARTSHADNTFNYSDDILDSTIDRAGREAPFSLQRILLIMESEWKCIVNCKESNNECYECNKFPNCATYDDDNTHYHDLLRIIKKIKKVEADIKQKYPDRLIETRICVYDHLLKTNKSLSMHLVTMQDIVVVNNEFIFREKFDITSRKRSDQTISQISFVRKDIDDCVNYFKRVWERHGIKYQEK